MVTVVSGLQPPIYPIYKLGEIKPLILAIDPNFLKHPWVFFVHQTIYNFSKSFC